MHNDFLVWLKQWYANLPSTSWNALAKNPQKIAIVSVDMVNGFCHKGPLASSEVKTIIPQVVDVFQKAHEYKVKKYILVQDAHHQNAVEFGAYPPHCVKGSDEAKMIPELENLPFSKEFIIVEKNALSPAYNTSFDSIIGSDELLDTFIIVGDCTDLCVYSMAMHLRLQANATNTKRRIIVAANAVATYDMPVEKAKHIGTLPHPKKLLHPLFLYHMALNAVEVVKAIE